MNKRKYLFAIAVLFTFLFSGCDKIFCKYKNLPDLGNGYKFETLGCKTLEIVNHNNTVMVMGVILNYAFDSTFIIASQKPWDSIPNINKMRYDEANKAFEQSTFRQYWIINKKEENERVLDTVSGVVDYSVVQYSNVYGPFQKKVFIKKKKQLGVSDSLKLHK